MFAKRAALHITNEYDTSVIVPHIADNLNWEVYSDPDEIFNGFKKSILTEIERMKKYHEQYHNENERRQSDIASA